jgi:prolyl oligopeptidase
LTEDHLLAPSKRPADLPELAFVKVDVQDDADINFLGNMFIISLRSDWTPKDTTYKSGSVIYCALDKFLAEGCKSVNYQVLFEPTERTAYEYFSCTKNYLILSTMDNVKAKLQFFIIGDNGNSLTLISGDTEASIRDCSVRALDATDGDEFWFTTSSYTQPTTLYLADASKMSLTETTNEEDAFIVEKLRTLPPQYDAAGLIAEQRFATSKDGTEVPYFIVMNKAIELNGKNPTLLYGYGGFEISLGPHYIAEAGLAWLERGGVYVEANIRGGGEFGPKWHQAALKENRNKAYEDFIAVAEHLIESGICKPKTLATRGGSNGGLLMGNVSGTMNLS